MIDATLPSHLFFLAQGVPGVFSFVRDLVQGDIIVIELNN